MVLTAVRTIIIYLFLIVAMRLMGKRQIGDLQPIELAVTLLISDLAVVPMQDSGTPLLSGLLPIFLLISMEILLSAVMLKFPLLAKLVTGNPVVVISEGKLLPNAMKALRLTLEDLTKNLRSQGVFDWQEVDTAIVETDGSISVYLKAENMPAKRSDVKKSVPKEPVPAVIVSDGQLCDWALTLCNWTKKRTEKTLRKEGYSLAQVFLMAASSDGKYTIVPKENVK